ncbi:MAG: phosphoribosyltransferase family protein [bacterium]
MILGKHDGVLKKSIWRLKYGFNKTISKDLASMLVDKFGEGISKKRPVVTWVPETKKKLRSRGYNQSKEIAQHFADKLLLCSGRLLAKNTETKSQVGLKKRERLMNVTGSFDYVGPKEINNNIVLIIDDVYTTGATLEECAKVLRRAGYREIWAMVLTRD